MNSGDVEEVESLIYYFFIDGERELFRRVFRILVEVIVWMEMSFRKIGNLGRGFGLKNYF